MMGCDGMMGAGWMGAPMVLWPVFLLALVVGGLWLLGRAFGDRSPRPGGDADPRALSILEERFARGEIDREEFEQRRQTLQR